jgi:hypothetical protein
MNTFNYSNADRAFRETFNAHPFGSFVTNILRAPREQRDDVLAEEVERLDPFQRAANYLPSDLGQVLAFDSALTFWQKPVGR